MIVETDILIVVLVVVRVKVRSELKFREENTSKYNRRVVRSVQSDGGVYDFIRQSVLPKLYITVLGFLTGTFLRRIPGMGLENYDFYVSMSDWDSV